jgi:hypothetical protein
MSFPLLGQVALLLCASVVFAAEHKIKPGDNPQAVMDAAASGDKLTFLPGLHQHGLTKHRAILYIDKSIEIELMAGATLKLADSVCQLEKDGEITTDQDAGKKLDDLEIGGEFDLKKSAVEGSELFGSTVYTILVDGVGQDGKSDTFSWGDGKLFDVPHKKIAINGEWQELSHGVKVKFGQKTGHSVRSLWFVSYDAPEAYGIRIGHGRQKESISGVRITGRGTIDLNGTHNARPSGLVKNINACVLIHGRVRNVLVEGITMTDTMRSVMAYGEHTGKFLPGGKVGDGESFDAENIAVLFTRTLNPNGSGYLFGHPSFRGQIRNVRCNYNSMETKLTAIEPNFNLDGYEIIGNLIKSDGEAIHCWRHSQNGVIADNLRIGDASFRRVISVSAPAGWKAPIPPVTKNNRNALGDRATGPVSSLAPKPFGRRLLVSDYSGNKVAIVAADGRIEWQTPAEKPQNSWLLTNGNVLFSHVHGVKEVRPDQSVAWAFVADPKSEVQGCQPLADGKVLVVECGPGRLIEVGRDGKIAKAIKVPLKTVTTHEQMRGCRKQTDGRYLVSAKGDRAILELSAAGKLIRTQPVEGDVHDVRELANGHWLVALGEGDGVVEIDKAGRITWNIGRNEITNNPIYLASSVERLADGHTVVMNWMGHGHLGASAQIFEIDAEKRLIRQFTDHGNFTSINHIQVLE